MLLSRRQSSRQVPIGRRPVACVLSAFLLLVLNVLCDIPVAAQPAPYTRTESYSSTTPAYLDSYQRKDGLGLGDIFGRASRTKAAAESKVELGNQAYEKARWALEHASKVHYRHNSNQPLDQVEESPRGDVVADCDSSGFISWVVYHVSPDRLWAVEATSVGQECPQAKTFARFFAALPADKPDQGWIGVPLAANLHRGDLIAWNESKSRGNKHGEGGHVMIVSEPPVKAPDVTFEGNQCTCLSIKVIDSSTVEHFPPEKLSPMADQKRRNGLGEGCIKLVLNKNGQPIAHWEGTFKGENHQAIDQPSGSPIIACGRMVGQIQFRPLKEKDLRFQEPQRTRNNNNRPD
jgi:hypothetical protein